MPSPACLVNSAATPPAKSVTAGSTVTISLASTAGTDVWGLSCVYTDELNVAATITAGLTIDNNAKTATFTAPAAGSAMIFRSQVNSGNDANGVNASYTTTFKIYVPTAAGLEVGAVNETSESNATFGATGLLNQGIRSLSAWTPETSVSEGNIYGPSVTTTDATPTVIWTYALAASTGIYVCANVDVYRASNGNRGTFKLEDFWCRIGSANCTRYGGGVATVDLGSVKDDAAWVCVIENSTTNVRVKFTGVIAETLKVVPRVQYRILG